MLGLLFSILAADAFLVLYQQQVSIYRALFHEVSEAKSLLEQVMDVCCVVLCCAVLSCVEVS